MNIQIILNSFKLLKENNYFLRATASIYFEKASGFPGGDISNNMFSVSLPRFVYVSRKHGEADEISLRKITEFVSFENSTVVRIP